MQKPTEGEAGCLGTYALVFALGILTLLGPGLPLLLIAAVAMVAWAAWQVVSGPRK
ncbi:MAG: hypothetical protein NT029_00745 [Armatimonadetes bacterium]|nr:hypothetical protein [Armatimonadota bacterium]